MARTMKMAFFTKPESMIKYYEGMIDGYTNTLARETETLQNEIKGIGKDKWLDMNNITYDRDKEWEHHIEWRTDMVRHLERKIRKFKKEIKALQLA